MAAFIITGVPSDVKKDHTITSLPLGTETVASVVGAGVVGIVYDSAAELNSGIIDRLIDSLQDALREETLKAS